MVTGRFPRILAGTANRDCLVTVSGQGRLRASFISGLGKVCLPPRKCRASAWLSHIWDSMGPGPLWVHVGLQSPQPRALHCVLSGWSQTSLPQFPRRSLLVELGARMTTWGRVRLLFFTVFLLHEHKAPRSSRMHCRKTFQAKFVQVQFTCKSHACQLHKHFKSQKQVKQEVSFVLWNRLDLGGDGEGGSVSSRGPRARFLASPSCWCGRSPPANETSLLGRCLAESVHHGVSFLLIPSFGAPPHRGQHGTSPRHASLGALGSDSSWGSLVLTTFTASRHVVGYFAERAPPGTA